jgi:antitoxin ParD1/3/4
MIFTAMMSEIQLSVGAPMVTLNISIPDDLKQKAEAVAARGGHPNVEEYIRTLIREDIEREIDPELEALLLEGKNSPAEEMTDAEWDNMRDDLRRRFGNRGG